MSRDITIYKTNPDPSKISLPFIFINPHFGYSVNSILRDIPDSPDVFLKPNIFPHNIKEYFWIHEGIPNKTAWYALGLIEEGLYFFYKAYTYTMFDKNGQMDLWVSHRFSDLIQYPMDASTYNMYITDCNSLI